MTEKKPVGEGPMEQPRTGSGEHPAQRAFRAKLDSINEVTLPSAEATLERARAARESTEQVLAATIPPSAQATPTSGTYTLIIQAVGLHHNGQPNDADRLLTKYARDLRAQGHTVTHIGFKNGTEETLQLESTPPPPEPPE